MKHTRFLTRPQPAVSESQCNPCELIIWLLNHDFPGASWLMDVFKCWVY